MSERKFKFRSTVDVDWTKTPKIEGVVHSKPEAVEKLDGRRVMTVDGGAAIFRVYESYELKELFDSARPGDHVAIEYLRTITLDGGKTMKQFNAQLWTE
jgi:hypothetical protein